MKVDKSVRTDFAAWLLLKDEAAKRGLYIGDFLTDLIRWSLLPHTMRCPNCEQTFKLYPPDHIQI